MAAEIEYMIVNNIPRDFQARQMRTFFLPFVETFGFQCFHYIHRPEVHRHWDERTYGLMDEELIIDVGDNIDIPEGQHWFKCRTDVSIFPNNERLKSIRQPRRMKTHRTALTNCCVISVKQNRANEFLKLYNKKHWSYSKGKTKDTMCLVNRIILHPEVNNEVMSLPRAFNKNDLSIFNEFHPPSEMPQGNIGTPKEIFLELFKKGLLSSRVSGTLGLGFKFSEGDEKNKKRKKNKKNKSCETDIMEVPRTKMEEVIVIDNEDSYDGKDLVIIDEVDNSDAGQQQRQRVQSNSEDTKHPDKMQWLSHTVPQPVGIEGADFIPLDMTNTCTSQGIAGCIKHNKPSAKQRKKNKFKNKSNKVLNPAKAAKLEKQNREKLQRSFKNTVVDTSKYVSSDDFTKGIGRKLLEKHGWQEGEGLGKLSAGIVKPVEGIGQHPMSRKGLGFFEEQKQKMMQKEETNESVCTVQQEVKTSDPTSESWSTSSFTTPEVFVNL